MSVGASDGATSGGGVSTAAALRSSGALRSGEFPGLSGSCDGFGKLAISAPGRDSQCSKYIPAIPLGKLFLRGKPGRVQSQIPEAISDFERELALNPGHAETWARPT